MTATFSSRDIGALIRRRGLPAQPVAQVQVSEIRSDQFVHPLPTQESGQDVAIAPLITEWRYRVPYTRMQKFHEFLAANEAFIAAGCQKVMAGVSYHGTYMGAVGQRNLYRTVWGYTSWAAHEEWAKVVADQESQLFAAVRRLRKYWVQDRAGTQEHFVHAAQVDPTRHPFINLTILASKRQRPPAGTAPKQG
jgi:hypothetical protein